jgi:hypothetical protein
MVRSTEKINTKICAPPSIAAPKRYCPHARVSKGTEQEPSPSTYVVLSEPSGVVFTDVEVRRQSDRHPGVNIAIGSSREIANVIYRRKEIGMDERGVVKAGET